VKVGGQGASGFRGAAARVRQHLVHRPAARQAGDEPVADLSRQRLSFRAEAGDVERHGVLEIDESMLAHLETDAVGLAVQAVLDVLAAEEPAYGLDVLAKRSQTHRALTEQAHAGVAGAEAHEAAARRQTIDRRDAVGGHRSEAEPWNVHAGAQADRTSLVRRQREDGPAVRADHRAVGDPGVRVAEVLGARDVADLVDLRGHDAEVHGQVPPEWALRYIVCRRASAGGAPAPRALPTSPGTSERCSSNRSPSR
jgi:hypothetical protein